MSALNWRTTADGSLEREFTNHERRIVQQLGEYARAMHARVADGEQIGVVGTDHYPRASSDPEAADEFARFAAPDVAAIRVERLDALLADLAPVDAEQSTLVNVPAERIDAWAAALADLRLLQAGPDRASRPSGANGLVHDWLGWLLEDLLAAADEAPQRGVGESRP